MIIKIKEKKEIVKGMLQVTFDTLGQEINFKAGQFFKLTLLSPPYTDSRGNSRFLGFTTSPSEKSSFSILTKMGVSGFKKSLIALPIGAEVEIGGVDGRVNNLPDDKSIPLVFIASEVGIAPLMGILRYSHENGWPYSITLVYANKNTECTAFLEELESFSKENAKFSFIPVMTDEPDWKGEKRSINAKLIKEYFPNLEKNIYVVVGAPGFVPNVIRELKSAGVGMQNIKMEIFTGY